MVLILYSNPVSAFISAGECRDFFRNYPPRYYLAIWVFFHDGANLAISTTSAISSLGTGLSANLLTLLLSLMPVIKSIFVSSVFFVLSSTASALPRRPSARHPRPTPLPFRYTTFLPELQYKSGPSRSRLSSACAKTPDFSLCKAHDARSNAQKKSPVARRQVGDPRSVLKYMSREARRSQQRHQTILIRILYDAGFFVHR